MYSLEITDVKKSFRTKKRVIKAVDGVTLAFGETGIYGLLGMNGAGKSTLIKICTGLTKPDGGSVAIFGRDASDAEVKRFVNISPQETAVAPMLTVRENIEFSARFYGADKADAKRRAVEIAERLRLGDRINERAGKLSGGMARRLSIGMAIVTEPKLVFLDEPTLGLDIVSRRELWKYIRQVAENAAVVLTTHYLEEAEALCERIAIMAHGKISAVGTCDELKDISGEQTFENAFLRLSGEEEYLYE